MSIRGKLRGKFRTFTAAAQKIDKLNRDGRKEALKGLRVVGEIIMTDVKAAGPGRGVPVDKGILRGTGKVTGPDDRGFVTLSFGGAAAPYALLQHERTDFRHDIGEARYLVRGLERFQEDGARAAQEALAKNMQFAIRRARGVG